MPFYREKAFPLLVYACLLMLLNTGKSHFVEGANVMLTNHLQTPIRSVASSLEKLAQESAYSNITGAKPFPFLGTLLVGA